MRPTYDQIKAQLDKFLASPELVAALTSQEFKTLAEQAKLLGALATPLAYARHCKGEDFLDPLHVQLISDTLADLVEGKLLRQDGRPYTKLMVNMPPRHGKSELITRAAPAWFLTRYPTKRVIITGYEADFAADFGRDARRYIDEYGESFGVVSDKSMTSKSNWGLMNGGGLKTAGAGGSIVGKGADFFVIDDPVKNSEEADSAVIRESHWQWYTGTILTRLEPGGVIVMVMTRWHEDDLGGRVLQYEPDQWYVLSLPAIADHTEGTDRVGRLPGEALWPQRYDEDALAEKREGVGPRWWTAQYQQKPSIQGGNTFKSANFRYFSTESTAQGGVYTLHRPNTPDKVVREDQCKQFMTIDLAVTTKNSSDFTVAEVFAVTPDNELLLQAVHRVRMEGADHEKFVHGLRVRYPNAWIGVEKATYGTVLTQMLRRQGVPLRELVADKDKETRALSAVALVDAERIYFARNASWLSVFELELLQFPYAAHDDQVDTLAYAARWLADRVRPPARPVKEKLSRHDEHFENFEKIQKRKQKAETANGMFL